MQEIGNLYGTMIKIPFVLVYMSVFKNLNDCNQEDDTP